MKNIIACVMAIIMLVSSTVVSTNAVDSIDETTNEIIYSRENQVVLNKIDELAEAKAALHLYKSKHKINEGDIKYTSQ